jgi:hypothetical protein
LQRAERPAMRDINPPPAAARAAAAPERRHGRHPIPPRIRPSTRRTSSTAWASSSTCRPT